MARRAKSTTNPTHLLGILGVLAAIAFGGYFMMHRSSAGSFSGGGNDLSLHEYLENSNALSGNAYQIEGIVEERLDNWGASEGRLFSVQIEEGSESSPVPVLVPPKFKSTNIQRGQRFKFKVRVQSESGILEVEDLTKA